MGGPRKIDRSALLDACYGLARMTMWASHPVDSDRIQAVANALCEIALSHEDTMLESGRDPGLLLLCIEYLEKRHAIPPMADDTRWFETMLAVLVELAVPTTSDSGECEGLFREIERGLAESRANYRSE